MAGAILEVLVVRPSAEASVVASALEDLPGIHLETAAGSALGERLAAKGPDVLVLDASASPGKLGDLLAWTEGVLERIPALFIVDPLDDLEAAQACARGGHERLLVAEADALRVARILHSLAGRRCRGYDTLPWTEAFSSALESLGFLTFTLDRDLLCTSMYGALAGKRFDPTRYLGRTLTELLGQEGGRQHGAALRQALEGEVVSCEWSTADADHPRFYQVMLSPVRTRSNRVETIVGMLRDVTELRWMQSHLMLSDRLSSVGTLAGGVAHNINNPLASILSNLEYALREIEGLRESSRMTEQVFAQLGEQLEVLRDAVESAGRIRDIVRDLQRFSSPDQVNTRPLDVNQSIEATLRLAWCEIRHRARLVKEYGRTPRIMGNEAQLRQVVLNLVVNAAEAIPEGNADRNEIRITTACDQVGNAVIEIMDTGRGIAPERLPHVFDPFFTTRPFCGVGMGLAISHRIVSTMGGQITCDSHVDMGTVFRVVLPPAPEAAEPRQATTRAAAPAVPGRVLVIDDDPSVCAAVRRALSREHATLGVTQACEALDLLRSGQTFDVIICDLLMPEMTGMDLFDVLAREAPALVDRIVFLTGGAFTPRARQFLEQPSRIWLEKPFDNKNLRAIVNRTVARARAGSEGET